MLICLAYIPTLLALLVLLYASWAGHTNHNSDIPDNNHGGGLIAQTVWLRVTVAVFVVDLVATCALITLVSAFKCRFIYLIASYTNKFYIKRLRDLRGWGGLSGLKSGRVVLSLRSRASKRSSV